MTLCICFLFMMYGVSTRNVNKGDGSQVDLQRAVKTSFSADLNNNQVVNSKCQTEPYLSCVHTLTNKKN